MASFDLPDETCRLAIVHDQGWAEVDLSKDVPSNRAAGNGVLARNIALTRWSIVSVHLGDGKPLPRPATIEEQSGFTTDANCWVNFSCVGQFDSTGTVDRLRCKPGGFLSMVMTGDSTNSATTSPVAEWSYFELQTQPLEAGEHRTLSIMNGHHGFRGQLTEVPGREWSFIYIEYVRQSEKAAGKPSTRSATSNPAAPAPTAAKPAPLIGTIYLKPTPGGEIGATGLNPGIYHLFANASTDRFSPGNEKAVTIERDFTVPEAVGSINLGTLAPTATTRPAFAVGDAAPALKSTTLGGQPFDLAALHGKWVLLDFWGTWCGFCVNEEPTYRDAFEGWGADGRLTMVSLSVDDTPDKVREHLKTHDMPWTHIVLGDREHTDVPQHFGVDGYPSVMLISPEGKLIATDLRGGSLRETLMRYLGPPSPPRR